MKLHFTFIFAVLLLTELTSCKKNISSTFDENIKIKMYEDVDSTKRTLTLHCFTEKIFPCDNYAIQTIHTLSGNKIVITFMRIIYPNICLTNFGPASSNITLTGLSNKTYTLEFNFPTIKITGQLDVSTGSYKATLPPQTNVEFVNPELNRVPDQTIYGTVHYHTASTSFTVQKFIDSLQFFGASPSLYLPGDYVLFQIDSSGQIKQTQDLGYYFTRYYIFNYSNNSAPLKNLVKNFGVNFADSLVITLQTTKGEIFYSWTQ